MQITHRPYVAGFLSAALALCAIEWWVVASIGSARNPNVLAFAVAVDLTIGIPALYYLLLVRARRGPPVVLAPIFLGSVAIAQLLLPPAQQKFLHWIALLVPLVELGMALFVLVKARQVVQAYRAVRPEVMYAGDALEQSVRRCIGANRFGALLTAELSLPYYLLLGWRSSFSTAQPIRAAFPYHRKNGYGAVVAMVSRLIVIETVAFHLLIQHWSPVTAWVLTGLSVYSLVWLVGDYQAARLNPIVLSATHLHVRTGLRWRVDVPLAQITHIRRVTRAPKAAPGYVNAAVYGEPRWLLELKEPIAVTGVFGIQRTARTIGFSVDDEPRLNAALRAYLQ